MRTGTYTPDTFSPEATLPLAVDERGDSVLLTIEGRADDLVLEPFGPFGEYAIRDGLTGTVLDTAGSQREAFQVALDLFEEAA